MLMDLFIFLWAAITNLITLLGGTVAVVVEVIGRYLGWEISNYWYVCIVIACLMWGMFAAWREEHLKVRVLEAEALKVNAPGYAEVSKDGTISFTENFDEYGLVVEKIEFEGDPAYRLTFEKEPARIKVETQEGAMGNLVRISSNEHRVRFIGAGYGDPIIECNFTVEAFKRR
jgi:hypothetical protein